MTGSLVKSLGFTQAPETINAADGLSAAFHADHGDRAVIGLDNHDTFETFHQVSSTLFGEC